MVEFYTTYNMLHMVGIDKILRITLEPPRGRVFKVGYIVYQTVSKDLLIFPVRSRGPKYAAYQPRQRKN